MRELKTDVGRQLQADKKAEKEQKQSYPAARHRRTRRCPTLDDYDRRMTAPNMRSPFDRWEDV